MIFNEKPKIIPTIFFGEFKQISRKFEKKKCLCNISEI